MMRLPSIPVRRNNLPGTSNGVMETGSTPKPISRRLALPILLWASGFIVVLVLALLLTWRACHGDEGLFSTVPLGGRFTYIQAKAIDSAFVAVITLAPVSFAGFCCRHVSRMAPSNQKDNIPTGAFVRTFSRLQYILFSILLLLSAIFYVLFSNVIAYEAYRGPARMGTVTMKHLGWWIRGLKSDPKPPLYLINTLNTLSFRHGTGFLDKDNTFVRANLTEASIANLSTSVVELLDVSAYRETISCEPANITHFTLSTESLPGQWIMPNISVGNQSKHHLYNS
jgi:hypothetical protein